MQLVDKMIFRGRATYSCRILQGRSLSSSLENGKNRSTLRELLRLPILKSLLLTLVFGSILVDYMRRRKELEGLELMYKSKFSIYESLKQRIQNGEKVNLQQDFKLSNLLTRNKYSSERDIEFDKELEDLLSKAEKRTLTDNTANDQKGVYESKQTSNTRDDSRFI